MTDTTDTSGTPGGPVRHGKRRKRSKLLIALLSVLGVVIVVGAFAGTYAYNLAHTFDKNTTKIQNAFPDESTRPKETSTGAQNILLMGSDSRGDSTSADSTSSSDQRTDSLMLMHIDADHKGVYVMSIMRDLYVPIPGHGSAKINAAYAYGGSALTVQTVEQLLGVRIDHVAIIDFQGFKDMTTALGGVDVVSTKAFRAHSFGNSVFDYTVGVNHLEGDKALAFVRERHAFPDSDFQRVKNQQAFVKGLASQVLSKSTLTNPTKTTDFVTAMSKYLSVDSGFSLGDIVSLGVSLRGLNASDIKSFTIPTSGTGMVGTQSVVNLDTAAMPGLKTALQTDALEPYTVAK